MKKLEIECRGIAEVSSKYSSNVGSYVSVELLEVDMDFLEQIPAGVIIANCDLNELLKAIDYDTLVEHLESVYDIEKIKERR